MHANDLHPKMTQTGSGYQFSNDWFDENIAIWSQLFEQLKPTRILEVGSYEGRSTTYIIENLANISDIEIHCIDSWEGGIEHKKGGSWESNMTNIEARFSHNMKIAMSRSTHAVKLEIHKGLSSIELPKLASKNMQEYFDFIYVDGSHQAPDVLLDAVLGFQLLRVGGVMIFDDYLWQEPLPEGTDPIRCPKIAIDAFTNIYCRKLRAIIGAPIYQLQIEKISH
jgi:predicted O-methyltransferase YrrM